jgi:hypothetical protein
MSRVVTRRCLNPECPRKFECLPQSTQRYCGRPCAAKKAKKHPPRLVQDDAGPAQEEE